MRGSTTMAASVISPALLFRLVILISLPSGAVKDVQVIQGIVQLVYKILDKYLDVEGRVTDDTKEPAKASKKARISYN